MGEKIINLLDETGVARPVPESEVQYRLDRGWRAETAQDAASRASTEAHDEVHGGVVDTLATGAGSLLSAGTFGATFSIFSMIRSACGRVSSTLIFLATLPPFFRPDGRLGRQGGGLVLQ